MSTTPQISVVMPTHNRASLLMQSLEALGRQRIPASQFEVLVVADACHDDTAQRVAAFARRAPYALRLLSHEARSAAATRNVGATHAQGQALLFLDDDVVPGPDLIGAHLQMQGPGRVVLGYSKPVLPPRPSWFQYDAQRWWEATFSAMARPEHRFTYRDFFSGNSSLPAALFAEVGGFDLAFSGRLEDYELGVRLLQAGARFSFAPGALGAHHDTNDLRQWLRRITQEGMADVQIGARHPQLRAQIFARFMVAPIRWRQLVRRLAFAYPARGDRIEQLLIRQIVRAERLRLRKPWRKLVSVVREYNYTRGVGRAIGGRRELYAWLQEADYLPAMQSDAPSIDLAHLPEAAELERRLRIADRAGLRVLLNRFEIMVLPPQPGAEPLRVEHVRGALRELAQREFVPALALQLGRSTAEAI